MATDRIVSVGPAGGGFDYTSLANAVASESKDLVALDRRLIVECHAMTDTSKPDVTGFTTDATRYIIIRAAAGSEANAIWRTSGVYLLKAAPLNAQGVINLSSAYTRLERIQIEDTSTFSNRGAVFIADVDFITCDGVFVKGAGGSSNGFYYTSGPNGANNVLRNCIAWNCGATGIGGGTSADGVILNCTAVACGVGITSNSQGLVNCVTYGCTTGASGAPTAASNNASGDATAPGANSLTLIANPFTNSAAGDFTLVTGAALIDAGADLSAQGVTTDIAGNTRPQGSAYDIGAFEYSSGGGDTGIPVALTGLSEGLGATSGTPQVAYRIPQSTSAGSGLDTLTSLLLSLALSGSSTGVGADSILSGAIPVALSGVSAGAGADSLTLRLTQVLSGASAGAGQDALAGVSLALHLAAASNGHGGDIARRLEGLPVGPDEDSLGLLLWHLWLEWLKSQYGTT